MHGWMISDPLLVLLFRSQIQVKNQSGITVSALSLEFNIWNNKKLLKTVGPNCKAKSKTWTQRITKI